MGVIALSDLIIGAILAVVGAAAFWVVGHTVDEVVDEVGKAAPKVLSPVVIIGAIVIAVLIVRARKG